MSDARMMGRYAAFIIGQTAINMAVLVHLEAVSPPRVPPLALPFAAIILIHFTVFPWVFSRAMGAKLVTHQTAPALHTRIEHLASRLGIPTPRVCIRDISDPNAVTTGIAGMTGTILVNRGLVEQLTDEELNGVLAHEMSHLANHDQLKSVVVGLISVYGVTVVPAVASTLHLSNTVELLLTISYLTGVGLLMLAFLRRNEYRADVSAAQTLGDGSPLADALVKTTPHLKHQPATLIKLSNPPSQSSIWSLFRRHPQVLVRINYLLSH